VTLAHFYTRSSRQSYLLGWALLIGLVACALFALATGPSGSTRAHGVLLGLGIVSLWRYGLAAVHAGRAWLYRLIVFPRLRRAAAAAPQATHVYALVLSYRMPDELNAAVYRALIRDLRDYGRPATIAACISDRADAQQLRRLALGSNVRLLVIQQSTHGKRDAMEHGLDYLARLHPQPGAVVALIDGDSFVPRGTLRATLPLLLADPRVGAVTTDNVPAAQGLMVMREWYRLRMRARHALMCSLSLSRRLLVLTGRFSVFRAEIALARGFIANLGNDMVHHWRLGSISMLTGDDKSTWFWALREGWDMLYVPDVSVCCLEIQPQPGFIDSTVALNRRYYGNMARNNGRALALGPRHVGWFPWFVLLDQRIAPWTSLFGPVAVLTLVAGGAAGTLAIYVAWVLATRTVQSAVLAAFGRAFHPLFPLILYFNQLSGAFIKIFAFFHLDRQKWTRQRTGAGSSGSALSSDLLMYGSLAAFALGVALLSLHMGR